jgi:plastocyanin
MNTKLSRRRLASAVALVAFAVGAGAASSVHSAVAPTRSPSAAKTVEVQMIGDASGYRFAPAKLTIQRSDRVKFTLVSGPPHNVVFWQDSIPKGAAAKLTKAMTNAVGPLTGPFLMNAGESYSVSFEGLPAGKYRYYCAPHLALGMTATIEVK